MKNVEEFVATMVKIDIIEDSNSYGHYPFQLYVELEDGKSEMNALALGGDVASCYKRFAKYKKENAKRIYLSLDFPKGGDIENDFDYNTLNVTVNYRLRISNEPDQVTVQFI
jgi:hypothetical protein